MTAVTADRADHQHAPGIACPTLSGTHFPTGWTLCEERAWRAIEDEYPEGTFSDEPSVEELALMVAVLQVCCSCSERHPAPAGMRIGTQTECMQILADRYRGDDGGQVRG